MGFWKNWLRKRPLDAPLQAEAQASKVLEASAADAPAAHMVDEAVARPEAPPPERVEVLSEAPPGSDTVLVHMERLRGIRALGDHPRAEALNNLLDLLCFDARGEVVIHASLALASRAQREEMLDAIRVLYNDVPVQCAAGYPPKFGTGVFPRMRLLYPLAWLGMADEIRKLLDGSGSWPGATAGKRASYELVEATKGGALSICKKLVFFEYLDEAGSPVLMEITHNLYPDAGLPSSAWRGVSGGE